MDTILRGRRAFIRSEQDRRRMVAYEQARWLGFAFHDPKNMPAFEPLAPPAAGAASAQATVDDAKVRGWFIAMSMRPH
jgi:hypothetical protein